MPLTNDEYLARFRAKQHEREKERAAWRTTRTYIGPAVSWYAENPVQFHRELRIERDEAQLLNRRAPFGTFHSQTDTMPR